MVQTPKYDNDTVNLGYLNKRLGETEESINNNNNSIAQIPKNYSTPPNPPYYKDSLLCYENKIYRCNITKLKGIFSWNDWSIVATDDSTVSDFINNTYEVEKLEIQEQIDGKIQTYYQENDPAIDWKTDLEKSKHIGDYWYNTNDNTQWRYNRVTTTTPITYAWGQVNVPKAIFDAIDTKKSIYTAKPTSYKKDDLWIIEESISDDDLPTGTDENPIAKGDWVFSIADSEIYNKEHWVKRDEDVSLSYLEQHYYTIGDINTSFEEIERNTDSKITKAKDEINLNVSQTYTTKTEHTATVNDFNEQIGTINQTITEHKETISNLSVEVGEVSASVESVQTRTEEISTNVDGIIKEINPTLPVTGSSIIIEDASNAPLIELEIEGKSTQETRSGKNKFNYASASDVANTTVTQYRIFEINGLEPTTEYIFHNYEKIENNTDTYIYLWSEQNYSDANKVSISVPNSHLNSRSLVSNEEGKIYLAIYPTDEATWGTYIPYFEKAQLELVEATEYETYGISPSPDYPSEIKSVGTYNEETGKYEIEVEITNGSNTKQTLIMLNEPLRSIQSDIKDKAYIKNNRLYVDKKIAEMVIDTSKLVLIDNYNNICYAQIAKPDDFIGKGNYNYQSLLCSTASSTIVGNFDSSDLINKILSQPSINNMWIGFPKGTTLEEIQTKLAGTTIQYELIDPYTEELGEIEMPSTFKDYNNIATTDDLEPIINIEYVRDTVLSNYVEQHVVQLKINEEQIRQSVETIDTSVDGLQIDISRVEQITTDNSQVLNIVSTNIDKTTGDVNAVTTKQKKFTFNDEGLKISAGENGFNSVQDETGTYYYDGTTPVGQYTKDGSKQKDLELFGTYSYGKTDIDDTPMFVGQLYTDENGEECFGHFYNGGDI